MRISCPFCGERALDEFTYLGDATLRRPAGGGDEAAMADYVYLRDNPIREHSEYWYHGGGCQSWLVVARNISTHEILSVHLAGQEGGA